MNIWFVFFCVRNIFIYYFNQAFFFRLSDIVLQLFAWQPLYTDSVKIFSQTINITIIIFFSRGEFLSFTFFQSFLSQSLFFMWWLVRHRWMRLRCSCCCFCYTFRFVGKPSSWFTNGNEREIQRNSKITEKGMPIHIDTRILLDVDFSMSFRKQEKPTIETARKKIMME